ncbi:class I SAM-dependent methyltransferase [Microcoleus vaginatus]|uniref:class I SAM-dependent methyltransferase n=1 Tax=Microcoleus vaginatus TaxID=119532 RepID=UPI001F61CF18
MELGCGHSSLSHVIAEHGCELIGVDTSAPGIALSRQTFPDCQLIQADTYDLPDIDMLHSFYLVLALEVIEQLLALQKLAKTAQKSLNSGEILIKLLQKSFSSIEWTGKMPISQELFFLVGWASCPS